MEEKGTGTFEEGFVLTNMVAMMIEGWSHNAVKIALTASLGELLARECDTPEKGEQQVKALGSYMAARIAQLQRGAPGLFDA